MPTKSLFPTQIYIAPCVATKNPLFKALQKEVWQIENADKQGLKWSERNYKNGYTSYGSWDQMHKISPHFEALKKKLDRHVQKYVRELGFSIKPRELYLSKLWVNLMHPQTIHSGHLHPLSVISGTFYLDVNPGSSPLRFEDPRMGLFMGRPGLVPRQKKEQQNFYHYQPCAGEVVLFESWLRHEVLQNTTDQTRISISFNYDWNR